MLFHQKSTSSSASTTLAALAAEKQKAPEPMASTPKASQAHSSGHLTSPSTTCSPPEAAQPAKAITTTTCSSNVPSTSAFSSEVSPVLPPPKLVQPAPKLELPTTPIVQKSPSLDLTPVAGGKMTSKLPSPVVGQSMR